MSSDTGVNAKTKSTKMAVKTDLKRSLCFLARDRAQANGKRSSYVHQPAALLELNRRKAADKRYNSIISARHRLDSIQSSLDSLAARAKHSMKAENKDRKSSAQKVFPSERTAASRSDPIPGFKYHYNGDEKQTTSAVVGAERLTGLGNHLGEIDVYGKRKSAGLRELEAALYGMPVRRKSFSSPCGPSSPDEVATSKSSTVARRAGTGTGTGSASGFSAMLRRYRRDMAQEGRAMASFATRPHAALDAATVHSLERKPAAILSRAFCGSRQDSASRRLAGQYLLHHVERSVPIPGVGRPNLFGNPDGGCDGVKPATSERSKEMEERFNNFLEDVRESVYRTTIA